MTKFIGGGRGGVEESLNVHHIKRIENRLRVVESIIGRHTDTIVRKQHEIQDTLSIIDGYSNEQKQLEGQLRALRRAEDKANESP